MKRNSSTHRKGRRYTETGRAYTPPLILRLSGSSGLKIVAMIITLQPCMGVPTARSTDKLYSKNEAKSHVTIWLQPTQWLQNVAINVPMNRFCSARLIIQCSLSENVGIHSFANVWITQPLVKFTAKRWRHILHLQHLFMGYCSCCPSKLDLYQVSIAMKHIKIKWLSYW